MRPTLPSSMSLLTFFSCAGTAHHARYTVRWSTTQVVKHTEQYASAARLSISMVVLGVGGELLASIMPDTPVGIGNPDRCTDTHTGTEAKPEDGRCMTSSRWHMYAFACQMRVCCAQVGSVIPFSGPQAALAQEVSEMCLSSIITAQHAGAECLRDHALQMLWDCE
jgi:hypothetical protein